MYIPGKNIGITKPEVYEKAIADFCSKWKITEFALFGSILRDDFRPDSSVVTENIPELIQQLEPLLPPMPPEIE